MDDLAGKLEGPLLIGIFINAVLLGVMTTQVYLYFTTFKDDRIGMKVFVIFLFLCDIVNTLCDFIGLYETLIQHFGDADYLTRISWLIDTDPVLTGIIATSCQLFYSWRIYRLTKRKILSILIATLAVVGGVFGLITSVKISEVPVFTSLTKFRVAIIVWLSSEVICDILITFSLVGYLSNHRTGFQHTDMLIDRIIRTTIQTGMITAIGATIALFLYTLNFNSGMHLLFSFVLCKLYSNSLMSTVNSRGVWMRSFRDDMPTYVEPINFLRTTVSSTERGSSFGGAFPSPIKVPPPSCHSTSPRTEVFVDIEAVEMQDRPKEMV